MVFIHFSRECDEIVSYSEMNKTIYTYFAVNAYGMSLIQRVKMSGSDVNMPAAQPSVDTLTAAADLPTEKIFFIGNEITNVL
jgi:hypothetical protein